MSEEQFKAFLDKTKADTNLQMKIKAAKSSDEVVRIAQDAWYEIIVEELNNSDLSEEDLEHIAGGGACACDFSAAGCWRSCGSFFFLKTSSQTLLCRQASSMIGTGVARFVLETNPSCLFSVVDVWIHRWLNFRVPATRGPIDNQVVEQQTACRVWVHGYYQSRFNLVLSNIG